MANINYIHEMRGLPLLCGSHWLSSRPEKGVAHEHNCRVEKAHKQPLQKARVVDAQYKNKDLEHSPVSISRRVSSITIYARRTSSIPSQLWKKSSFASLRRGSDSSHHSSEMTDLQRQLISEQLPAGTCEGNKFLPYSVLEQKISTQLVQNTLSRRGAKLPETTSKIASFVCGEPGARRVFAILACLGHPRRIELFYEHNFDDSILPLYIDQDDNVRTRSAETRHLRITEKVFADDFWEEGASPWLFCQSQWQFLGPVFNEHQFRYSFCTEHRMPFLEQLGGQKESHFSTVGKWSIHQSHFEKSSRLRLSVDTHGHPIVAVKELKNVDMNDEEYKRAAEAEAQVLQRIREMEHPHLIEAIAYYKKGDRYFIIFPWAGGGNLRDYWGKEPPRKLDADFVSWALGQLCGLASAMNELHSTTEDSSCRHGDLKPENILCFENTRSSDSTSQPFFVIADVGLAKVHTLVTEMRNEATRTMNGTVMYEPPEAVLLLTKKQPRSRRYDVWSIGCIYFEFLIWLLYGKAELLRFSEDITHPVNRTRQFFDVHGFGVTGAASIKSGVQKWMDWIRRDPRCPPNTAIRRLLELICTRLLVTELDDEWECSPDVNTAQALSKEIEISRQLPLRNTTSTLCFRCKDLQQRLWSQRFSFSDNLGTLAKDLEVCDLCRLLFFSLESMISKSYGEIRFEKFNSYLTSSVKPGRPVAVLYSLPGKPSLGAQMGMPVLPAAGSQAHIAALSTWIRVCDGTHDCIRVSDTTSLPTRVIDVGSKGAEHCRLLCADRGQTKSGKYLALSHRWGSPNQHRKFCTLKENLESFKEEIKLTELPQTFQDAINITRNLGIGYLWIDSLCIVQDDPEDWKMESLLMEQVYSSAYVTLAASCASGTEDGFLKPRPRRQCVTLASDRGSYYICESIDDFGRDVEHGELNKRAWILQERALSRRTIYFSEKQTYWECGRGVRCETMTKMRNRKASFLGDSDFPHSIDTYVRGMKIELYQDLYQKYSGLALSSIGDRPVAIRGLEARLIRTFGTVGSHGVFDIFFHRCLLWKKANHSLDRIDSELLRGVHVPSWSWMAYAGEIKYLNVPFNKYSWDADIISPFSNWSSQSMKERSENEAACEIKAPVWDFRDAGSLKLELDNPDRGLSNLKCVIVARKKDLQGDPQQSHYVIVVHSVAIDGLCGVYERVGVAEVRGEQIAFKEGSQSGILK
ncbi:HET-domain-containing protein [Colletotrichum scovillei]|nr:HET-domain-containing protein [Colletotrichum scovillei]